MRECGNEGKLLDIGCSAGFFIACLERYGWDVSGIDISQWASKFAREKLGLNVFTGSVDEIELNERFHVITMYHTLEHLPDPLRSLKRVSEMISDDGVLVIKGPNLASFDRIWHGKKWRGYDLPLHLYHFTPRTYQMFLQRGGFSPVQIRYQYWNPIGPLQEIRSGDGIRADHAPDAVKRLNKTYNNLIFKGISKVAYIAMRLLNLRGQDLTIYAKKRDGL